MKKQISSTAAIVVVVVVLIVVVGIGYFVTKGNKATDAAIEANTTPESMQRDMMQGGKMKASDEVNPENTRQSN